MIDHTTLDDLELHKHIRAQKIRLGGNKRLMIFGTLDCRSGKRMKKQNRVFFTSEDEALSEGYRPCGHCMREKYNEWKNGLV
ncbi:MAG: Ada metal-binding domain-containing protein [Reichenbachiella sp.]|uniref:Ada metal-binding domain-containing protein n=1 Tax=Reichenbachiella sp. TaxID=2184521 RepID=UPI003267BABD